MFYVYVLFQSKKVVRMARGLQAQQSQAKAQEKAAKLKKMQVLSLFLFREGITVDDQLRETASTTTPRRQPLGSSSPAPSAGQP